MFINKSHRNTFIKCTLQSHTFYKSCKMFARSHSKKKLRKNTLFFSLFRRVLIRECLLFLDAEPFRLELDYGTTMHTFSTLFYHSFICLFVAYYYRQACKAMNNKKQQRVTSKDAQRKPNITREKKLYEQINHNHKLKKIRELFPGGESVCKSLKYASHFERIFGTNG